MQPRMIARFFVILVCRVRVDEGEISEKLVERIKDKLGCLEDTITSQVE
jgi:hypothetical protein